MFSIGTSGPHSAMSQSPPSGDPSFSTTSRTWVSQILGDRDVYYRDQLATNYMGKYTMVIAGGTNAAVAPAGDGYALITVKTNGGVKCSGGMLGDGHRLRTITRVHRLKPVATTVSKNGDWAFYAMLYSEPSTYTNNRGVLMTSKICNGSIMGWMQFTNNGNRDLLDGNLFWTKMRWTNSLYPSGFTNEVETLGSAYTPPAKGSRALTLTDAVIVARDGNLGAPFTNYAVLGLNNKFTFNVPNVNTQVFMLKPGTGQMIGHFHDPEDGTETLTYGAVLQDENVARGFFLGTNQSGSVRLKGY